jgi:ABC-type glutathione transport system ATPase component
MTPLLEIDNLKVVFHGDGGRITRAVDGVSLAVRRGRTLGVVGESGSGKSVTFLAALSLRGAEGDEAISIGRCIRIEIASLRSQ